MVIYVSLLSILLAVVVEMSLVVAKSYRTIKAARFMENTAVASFERMTREVRLSQNIVSASSTLGSHPGVLFLTTGPASTTEFYLESGVLKLKEDGVYQGPLSATGTSITNLVFRVATNTRSSAVKIEMTIEGSSGNVTRTKNFSGTAVTRGSY